MLARPDLNKRFLELLVADPHAPPSAIALHITGGMVLLFKTTAVYKNTPSGIGRPIVNTLCNVPIYACRF